MSTLAYVGVLLCRLGAMDKVLDRGPSVLGGIAMGGLVFVAPFIAAAVGLIGGGALGLWRCWGRLRASETYQ